MKKCIYNVALIASCLAAAACGGPKHCRDKAAGDGGVAVEIPADRNEEIMGDWAPVDLSESRLSFPRRGGEAVVTCRNYDTWWINDVQVCGEEAVTHAEPGADNSYRTLEAEGISAEIVDGNKVKITVPASAKACCWDLHLQSGDAFATIHIEKKGKK